VAHSCNPSCSGDRDQEDRGLKPAQAKSLQDCILKIPNTKRAGGVAQGIGPEFKPWYPSHHTRKVIFILQTKKCRFRDVRQLSQVDVANK
jgi:hypothetical protein